jgi:hypothetical protein
MEQSSPASSELLNADIGFHLALGQAGHNAILLNALLLIRNLMQRWIAVHWQGKALLQHNAIFEAIARRDPGSARAASAAQPDLVDTACRAAVPNSIPQTVYEKHSQTGNCFERLVAPLQCDAARGHHERSKRPAIAVNVYRSERYKSFSRPTFCDHRGTAFDVPLLSETF